MSARLDHIRHLNDELRRVLPQGSVYVTGGIHALSADTVYAIGEAVSTFDGFRVDDHYDERDFGLLDVAGRSILFKIDYYDLDKIGHSPDPADPSVTRRVLTIMLADEY